MYLAFLHMWMGPLPIQHIWISPENKPKKIASLLRVYVRKWFFHPVKRRMAKYYLAVLRNLFGLPVIGITGSFGKTTTKEILLSILSQSGLTVASYANIDPVYNIPTTILKCSSKTKYLILEMGIEYPGEMDFYLWLAPVDIAIITGIGLSHTEFLEDTKTIYAEKSKIFRFAKHIIDYSKARPNFANNQKIAVQVAKYLGVKPDLSDFTPPPHRMYRLDHPSGAIIIDDSYNANPTAVKLAIDYLVSLAKKEKKTPVFVLAQMNELGEFEKSSHQDIANYVAKKEINHFFTLGPANQGYGQHFGSKDKLIAHLKKFLRQGHIVLIKGSRSWKMEEVVDSLT